MHWVYFLLKWIIQPSLIVDILNVIGQTKLWKYYNKESAELSSLNK